MCFYWSVELKTRTQKTHMSKLSQAVRFSLTLPLWTIYILQWTRQTCGLKKLTDKMEMMLPRNEWISLIGCRTFQRYGFHAFYSICSNFRNCLSQNMEPFSLRSTSWGVLTARVMMNCLWYDYFFVMLETEESISEGSSFQEQFSRVRFWKPPAYFLLNSFRYSLEIS